MDVYEFIYQYKRDLLAKIDNIIGIYLFGSLVYGGFNEKTSDIDLVVITKTFLNSTEMENIKEIHEKLNNNIWSKRYEVSYTPIEMFKSKNIPILPRPYYNELLYYEATYGNEWLINNYLLYNHSKTIYGPEFKTLIEYSIGMEEIIQSCIKDFYKEWLPKTTEDEWFKNSHYQSYIVLNICRIIFTIYNSKLENKQNSAKWVKEKHFKWKKLIDEAEEWDYSKIMNRKNEIKEFIKYMENIINVYKSKSNFA